MKKTRIFTSQETYQTWAEAHDEIETPIWTDDGWQFTAELTTECKSYKTACKRFKKAFESFELTKDWLEGLEECYESGYPVCSEISDPEHGIYKWGIDDIGEGYWYIYLVVTGCCRGDGTTAKPETIETAQEPAEAPAAEAATMTDEQILKFFETMCSVDQGTDVNPQVTSAQIIARNAIEARHEPAQLFDFYSTSEVKLLNGFQISTGIGGHDFTLGQNHDLHYYEFSTDGANAMIDWLMDVFKGKYQYALDMQPRKRNRITLSAETTAETVTAEETAQISNGSTGIEISTYIEVLTVSEQISAAGIMVKDGSYKIAKDIFEVSDAQNDGWILIKERPSAMELEGMKHGTFPMSKNFGIIACREYEAALHAQGYTTWLKYFSNDLFHVESEKKAA